MAYCMRGILSTLADCITGELMISILCGIARGACSITAKLGDEPEGLEQAEKQLLYIDCCLGPYLRPHEAAQLRMRATRDMCVSVYVNLSSRFFVRTILTRFCMEDLEFGEPGYAVIDVEALILGPVMRIVEQVGFVLISSSTGKEIMGEKHIVYQPYDDHSLAAQYGQPQEIVDYASSAYRRITGDNPIHDDPSRHPTWCAVKTRLRKILRRRAIKVYAKGAALERTVFGKAFPIYDLEWTGCPKYPEPIHDPLEECRFFANYIPELQRLRECESAEYQMIPVAAAAPAAVSQAQMQAPAAVSTTVVARFDQ